MKGFFKKGLLLILVGLLIFSLSGCGQNSGATNDKKEENQSSEGAVNYPTKPITIVVPYNPGGGVDTSTRTIQPFLQDALGQPVVVENRPGGGMSVGYNYVAGAKPDGYTFMAAPIPTMIFTDLTLPNLKAKFNEFKPVASWVNDDCSPLVVRADSPYKTLKDFVEAAKSKTMKLGLSGGAYSTDHMTYAMLSEVTGVKFNLVPYGSSGEALAALEGGHVDAILASLVTAITAQDAGQAKILAVSKNERLSIAPDIPTFKEQGYDVVIEFHIGLFAPPNTPDDIVKIMADKLVQAASSEEFRNRVKEVKSPAGEPMTQEEWSKYCQDEYNRWKEMVNILEKHPLG
ncbi:MAG TPA: tripartite tricarboxylate transporter substrate binding protein [Thermoanaerobacterales bacterium]|nr:hypothetical protein [Thermoanaerobacteraceae bacterium]HHW02307.1 tripartite tricarboxylate transporter substrate binding protein [Thermoanaerobacterales bacterium]